VLVACGTRFTCLRLDNDILILDSASGPRSKLNTSADGHCYPSPGLSAHLAGSLNGRDAKIPAIDVAIQRQVNNTYHVETFRGLAVPAKRRPIACTAFRDVLT
jgi:hypothetical protein